MAKRRTTGTIRVVGAADYTNYEGYSVNLTSVAGVLTATVSTSATVVIEGIITEPGTVAQQNSIFIPGADVGTVDLKLSGTVAAGDKLIQAADGTFVVDTGSGARVWVAIALEAGVSGDLIEAAIVTPVTLS